jgi:hypothetical protein
MIPANAIKKIRRVNIHFFGYHYITGLSFFDKGKKLLWKIGYINSRLDVETVVLEENEVIVGVSAKLHPDFQSSYTDF